MPLKLASKWLRREGRKDEVLKDAKHLNPMHKHPVYCEGAVEVAFAGTSAGSGAAGCGCGAEVGSGAAGCGCGTSAGSGVRCFEGPKMVAYVNGVSEAVFKVGMCLPAGPYVSDSDVEYIVESIKGAMR